MVVCSPLLAEYFNDYIRALVRAQYETRPASLTPPAAQANRPEGVQTLRACLGLYDRSGDQPHPCKQVLRWRKGRNFSIKLKKPEQGQ